MQKLLIICNYKMNVYLKKLYHRYLLLLVLLLQAIPFAYAAPIPVPAPPQVAARNYLILDFDSMRVLAEKKPDEQIEPASITKLMTAYVVYHELESGRLSMDEMVEISKKSWRMGGSRMYLEVGSKVSVEQLLKGLIIQSGNDASVALAEHIAGSEEVFVELMNNYAKILDLKNTHYKNSTGWPDKEHLTSARDIAKLSAAIIREFPEHYKWYEEKSYTYNDIKQYNRNKLLWRDDSVDGLKTGHTESAGYCLVASAKRSEMRLISVVLGTKNISSRASVSQSLLNYGFRFYETHQLYAAGELLSRSRVWSGEHEEISLGLSEDLRITIPRGSYKNLEAFMDVNADIEAPLKKGQKLGVVRVSLDNEELLSRPLVALESIEKGNILQIIKDHVLRLIN